MRSRAEFHRVIALVERGHNDCQIARMTGLCRVTVREWRHKHRGLVAGKGIPRPEARPAGLSAMRERLPR